MSPLELLERHAPVWTWVEVDASTILGEREMRGVKVRLVVTAPLLCAELALPVTGRLTAGRLALTHATPNIVALVRELEEQAAASLKRGAHTESDEIRVRPYAERYGDLT